MTDRVLEAAQLRQAIQLSKSSDKATKLRGVIMWLDIQISDSRELLEMRECFAGLLEELEQKANEPA